MTCVSSSKTELCGNLGDDAEMIHRRYDTALLQRIAQTGSSISIGRGRVQSLCRA